MFDGSAARWLELVQRRAPNASWSEFCNLLMSPFGRNKHQNLLRQLFSIRQTSTVEEYVERFSELFDQLTAYEDHPNTVHYVTRFMEGLTPPVRILVGIQQPLDLDSAYALALLSDELTNSSVQPIPFVSSTPSSRVIGPGRSGPSKPMEEKKVADSAKLSTTEDRWSALRAFRRSKGLCFVCGER